MAPGPAPALTGLSAVFVAERIATTVSAAQVPSSSQPLSATQAVFPSAVTAIGSAFLYAA